MDVEQLIREIEQAFPSRDLDGGISMTQALLDDDYEGDDAAKMSAAYKADVTHDWKEIPIDDIDQLFSGFSVFVYLDQKGWAYYLPAALRASLKHPASLCEFYTRISLLPNDKEDRAMGAEHIVTRFVNWLALTAEQTRAIARTLHLLRERNCDYYDEHTFESQQIDVWVKRYAMGDR